MIDINKIILDTNSPVIYGKQYTIEAVMNIGAREILIEDIKFEKIYIDDKFYGLYKFNINSNESYATSESELFFIIGAYKILTINQIQYVNSLIVINLSKSETEKYINNMGLNKKENDSYNNYCECGKYNYINSIATLREYNLLCLSE